MRNSRRIPGEPFRYIAAENVSEDMQQTMNKFNVEGDGERGVPVRTAKPEDADRAGVKRKPSPLT